MIPRLQGKGEEELNRYIMRLNNTLDLEERLRIVMHDQYSPAPPGDATYLEVPHLPSTNCEQHDGLSYRPPLDAVIRRLCGVPVHPLAHHNILLLVLDSLHSLNKITDFFF